MRITLFCCFLLTSVAAVAQTTYLHCGRLMTLAEYTPQTSMTIVVEGDRIARIEKGYVQPAAGELVIDLKDKTVLPGLIDCHVHLEWEISRQSYLERYTLNDADYAIRASVFARRTLQAGFTTVRDLGGRGANIAVRNAINQGWIPGPRILTSGRIISITGGHGDATTGSRWDLFDPPPGAEDGIADGPDACRQAVRTQVKRGADLIKVTATGGVLSLARDGLLPHYAPDELEAIVQTAHDLGVPVAAHAHGDEGMRRAVLAGVTSIEHGTFMSDTTMDLMLRNGTWYVPTLTAGWAVSDSAQYVDGFFPEQVRQKALGIGPKISATLTRAYERGLKIAFGTDAGVFPHGKNNLEFYFLTRAGMSNLDALLSATVHAAEMLRLEDQIGTLEPGKAADIIAVEGDPLQDIRSMEKVRFVMRNGKVYKSSSAND
ncbi:MAG: amidohydrolase family protein [Bacteroidetes bacterium]|nr:MAG: amidohydrolase family protein [Bacteroidota bacterium]